MAKQAPYSVYSCNIPVLFMGFFAQPPTDFNTALVGKGIGHFFDAMEIDGFMDVTEFKKRINHIK